MNNSKNPLRIKKGDKIHNFHKNISFVVADFVLVDRMEVAMFDPVIMRRFLNLGSFLAVSLNDENNKNAVLVPIEQIKKYHLIK